MCITLEKAEKRVWDYLLSEPPPTTTRAAPSAASAISYGATRREGAVDVSDVSESEVRAKQMAAALSGLTIAEPDAKGLMDAAIGAELAPPKPLAVATGPTEQAGTPPRTGPPP